MMKYLAPATRPDAGMVKIQARIMRPATPQRTAERRHRGDSHDRSCNGMSSADRLNVVPLFIALLRERTEDVLPLALDMVLRFDKRAEEEFPRVYT
jgi:hypothetical protein